MIKPRNEQLNLSMASLPDDAKLTVEQKNILDILQLLLSSKSQGDTLDDFIDYLYRRFSGTEMVLFAFHGEDQIHVARSLPELDGNICDESFPALSSQILTELDDLDNNAKWCQSYRSYFPHVSSCLQVKISVGACRYVLLIWNEDGRKFNSTELNQLLFGMESAQLVMSYLVSMEDNDQSDDSLYQRDKLASLGKLAAGVAHEINNPLGFVMSNFSTLASYVNNLKKVFYENEQLAGKQQLMHDLMHETDEILTETMEGLTRIQNIVSSLNVYSHSDPVNYNLVDLRDVVESALSLIFGELKLKAHIEYKMPATPYYVLGQVTKLRQVVIDIVVNALQSIHHENGRISVNLCSEDNGLSPRKRNVLLVIRDNGKGIPEQDIDLVFDPFFTTKQVGDGAGLGLSVAKEIIDDHQGTITIDSQTDSGTQVAIRLPGVAGKS